jgi:single-strand DNA-binding protein
MASVNKVILIGRLGKDPELSILAQDVSLCKFSLATTRSWKSKSGDKMEDTDWHSVTIFGKLAEIAGKYLKKGRSVYIEGQMRTRKWTDKSGVERETTEVVCDEMKMLGDKREADTPADAEPKRLFPKKPAALLVETPTSFSNMDDDIPF